MTHAVPITVLFGHPVAESYCNSLAAAYCQGARDSGAEVREIHLAELDFDPQLRRAYLEIQPLEPDLLAAQDAIRQAQHLVIAFPVWWGMPPALLKGFIDRVFHPGFAFKYPTPESLFPNRLLGNRSARIICTMDSPPLYFRFVMGSPALRMMKRSVLTYCGIKPVRCQMIGSVRFSTLEKRRRWLDKVYLAGKKQQ